jgi:hypothetical protein
MHLFSLLFTALLAPLAYADYGLITESVEQVGQNLTDCGTSCDPTSMAIEAVATVRPVLASVAVAVLMIAGIRMVTSQEDDRVDQLKKLMTAAISGIVMSFLILPFIQAFYGTTGEVVRGDMEIGVEILETEIGGLINWALTIAATVALLMIFLTIVKALSKMAKGSDEGIGEIRNTLFSVMSGLIILVLKYTLSFYFVSNTHSPIPILGNLIIFISYLLGFLGLLAVIVVVYAGILCLVSFGNEEALTKAKGILGRAALGAVILLSSLAIVNFILWPTFA